MIGLGEQSREQSVNKAIVMALIPLIEKKYNQREIGKHLNKSLGWVNTRIKALSREGFIEKRGNRRSGFYAVNSSVCSSFLRGVEDSPDKISKNEARVHNTIIKFPLLKSPRGLNAKKINLNNWAKYQHKYGGVTIEWSRDVKKPFFIVHYPITYGRDLHRIEQRILDDARKIAFSISEDYGMKVLDEPDISHTEIAIKGDPVAELVRKIANYDNGHVKVDASEKEDEHEYYGAGDTAFEFADAYFDMPQKVREQDKVLQSLVQGQASLNRTLTALLGLAYEFLKKADYNNSGNEQGDLKLRRFMEEVRK